MEIKNRIKISLAAYAYEIQNSPIMSDAEYDRLALSINPLINTNNPQLDAFFATEYSSFTSQWIYKHPELEKLAKLYHMCYGK